MNKQLDLKSLLQSKMGDIDITPIEVNQKAIKEAELNIPRNLMFDAESTEFKPETKPVTTSGARGLTVEEAKSFDDEMNEIPVNEETKDLICIGNKSKNRLKVQITSKEGCEKYEIRTEPKIISLKPGEACEFNVFITPFCTCHFEDEIKLIVLDIKKGCAAQHSRP